jgi:Protein of unknown function (DUF2628)
MMKIFTLYTKNSSSPLDSLKVVSEGFNIGAFIWSLLWLLYNQLWDYFIVCSLILLCLINLSEYERLSSSLLTIAMIIIPIVLGILGNDIIRKDLEKSGYKLIEIIAASSLDEAELKFLTNLLKSKKNAKASS